MANLGSKSLTTPSALGRKRSSVDECLSHAWIQPQNKTDRLTRRKTEINIENFKNFHARRRWKVSGQPEVHRPIYSEQILVSFQHSMRVVTLCNKLSRSRGSLGTPPPVRREDALSNMKVGEPASEVRFNTSASARFLDLRTYT